MDCRKTGELIAAARKSRGMTQQELGRQLHISDRTVSKWERGAGFPDISLLEPLAHALGLSVLELLRGERGAAPDAETAVSETLSAVRQVQRSSRWEMAKLWLQAAAGLGALLLILAAFRLLALPTDKTVPAGVYRDGVLESVTLVRWDGVRRFRLPWQLEFHGHVQTPLSQVTLDEERDMTMTIPLREEGAYVTHTQWTGNVSSGERPFLGNGFCLDWPLEDFAFSLTDGRVVATSPQQYRRYLDTFGSP